MPSRNTAHLFGAPQQICHLWVKGSERVYWHCRSSLTFWFLRCLWVAQYYCLPALAKPGTFHEVEAFCTFKCRGNIVHTFIQKLPVSFPVSDDLYVDREDFFQGKGWYIQWAIRGQIRNQWEGEIKNSPKPNQQPLCSDFSLQQCWCCSTDEGWIVHILTCWVLSSTVILLVLAVTCLVFSALQHLAEQNSTAEARHSPDSCKWRSQLLLQEVKGHCTMWQLAVTYVVFSGVSQSARQNRANI